MFRTGEWQELRVVKKVDFGVYLAEEMPEEDEGRGKERPAGRDRAGKERPAGRDRGGKDRGGSAAGPERILLPRREVTADLSIGSSVRVFVYLDSEDRPIATRREPRVTLGKFAAMRVVEVNKIGAFLDWGLDKDLLLPYHEQTGRVRQGDEVLAALYLDKSGRLCATMKLSPYLSQNSPYRIGDRVQGRVYEISGNFGVFVAVDDRYSALIPRQEAAEGFSAGDRISARVTYVHEDGKLNLSVREKAWVQMEEDAETILRVIDAYDGVLPFGEKVPPEVIRREFGMSKAAFKRGLGRLLKEEKIEITENRVYRR